MGLPVDCSDCSAENCQSVFDHDSDCPTANRIAERQLERQKDNLGTVWEVSQTEKWIEMYENFLEESE